MNGQPCNLRRVMFVSVLILTAGLFIVPPNALAQQKGNAFTPAPPPCGSGAEPLAINTELVSLRVSVTDKQGRSVLGWIKALSPSTKMACGRKSATSAIKTYLRPSAFYLMSQAQ